MAGTDSEDKRMKRYSAHIVAETLEQMRVLDRFGLDLKHRAARRVEEGKYIIPGILSDVQIDQVKDAG